MSEGTSGAVGNPWVPVGAFREGVFAPFFCTGLRYVQGRLFTFVKSPPGVTSLTASALVMSSPGLSSRLEFIRQSPFRNRQSRAGELQQQSVAENSSNGYFERIQCVLTGRAGFLELLLSSLPGTTQNKMLKVVFQHKHMQACVTCAPVQDARLCNMRSINRQLCK